MSALLQVSGGSPNAAVADVVFVHGIQGDPHGTWTNKNSGFWPYWLAEDNAGLAVWSAGYKAAVSEWAGTAMPLFDRANNVLAELQAAGIGGRPICWVTHSMGGLLVKKMLRNADSLAAEFRSFSDTTRGVVFIGTPHTGSDLASLSRYLGFILRLSAAAKELQPLSAQLLELNTWYRENHRRLGVATQVYFETQTTKGVWVVDRGTADPGLEGVTPIGLDADHLSICKPSGKDDLIYKRTMAFIRSALAPQTANTDGRPQASAHAAVAAQGHPDPTASRGRVRPPAAGHPRLVMETANTDGRPQASALPGGNMGEELVDGELLEGIGEAAGQALGDAARLMRRAYSLDRWLVNGRSRAPVAVVIESDLHGGRSRRLVLKVPVSDRSGSDEPAEYTRHRAAYAEAPEKFAKKHLTIPEDSPIRVGDGQWITLQSITGDAIEMTVLLNSMLKIPGQVPMVGCDSRTFAEACGTVVASMLGQWNGRPYVARPSQTVAQFLRHHLHDQLEPGGRLHALSQRNPGDTIELPGEEQPLPNPLALARGEYFGDQRIVRTIVGCSHGDLHTDNILVKVRPRIEPAVFSLIDLANYEKEGPLTQDPVHLVLYILARRMDVISGHQKAALIEILLDPEGTDPALLPPWLQYIIEQVEGAAATWLEGSGLDPEWRQQRLLSLVGCGLLFLGRTSTRPQDHGWFLRLAARAAAAYVALNANALGGTSGGLPKSTDRPAARIAWRRLQGDLPVTWLADMRGLPRLGAPGTLEIHIIPTERDLRLPVRRLSALTDELAEIGRDAGLLPEAGASLAVQPDGQRSAWQPLPADDLGAVLDEDDLAIRITALLSALARVNTQYTGEVGIAVGVATTGLLSEGRVADLPRTKAGTTDRGWTSRRPVRLPAREALSFTYLDIRPHEVAAELAARVISQFREARG